MKALLGGQRQINAVAAAALVGLACLLVASIGLNWKHASDLDRLHRYLYQRCVARQAYDAASQQVRTATRDYWTAYIREELTNRFIDEHLRAERTANAQRMVDALDDTLTKSVPGSCAAFR